MPPWLLGLQTATREQCLLYLVDLIPSSSCVALSRPSRPAAASPIPLSPASCYRRGSSRSSPSVVVLSLRCRDHDCSRALSLLMVRSRAQLGNPVGDPGDDGKWQRMGYFCVGCNRWVAE